MGVCVILVGCLQGHHVMKTVGKGKGGRDRGRCPVLEKPGRIASGLAPRLLTFRNLARNSTNGLSLRFPHRTGCLQ